MGKINDLRKELADLVEVISLDLTKWEPSTRPGMVGRQNEAKSKLNEVKSRLGTAILHQSRVFGILESNKQGKEIYEHIGDNPSYVFIDFLALERRLFNAAFPNKNLVFSAFTINSLNVELANVVRNNEEVVHLPDIKPDAKFFREVSNKEQAIKMIANILFQTFGNDLKGVVLREEIYDSIFERITLDRLRFVLINLPEQLDADFIDNVSGVHLPVTMVRTKSDLPRKAKKDATADSQDEIDEANETNEE